MSWKPPGPVAFAMILCFAMLIGDLYFGRGKNPMALVFYTSLPSVFWMMAELQRRDAQAIRELSARVEQLERLGGRD